MLAMNPGDAVTPAERAKYDRAIERVRRDAKMTHKQRGDAHEARPATPPSSGPQHGRSWPRASMRATRAPSKISLRIATVPAFVTQWRAPGMRTRPQSGRTTSTGCSRRWLCNEWCAADYRLPKRLIGFCAATRTTAIGTASVDA